MGIRRRLAFFSMMSLFALEGLFGANAFATAPSARTRVHATLDAFVSGIAASLAGGSFHVEDWSSFSQFESVDAAEAAYRQGLEAALRKSFAVNPREKIVLILDGMTADFGPFQEWLRRSEWAESPNLIVVGLISESRASASAPVSPHQDHLYFTRPVSKESPSEAVLVQNRLSKVSGFEGYAYHLAESDRAGGAIAAELVGMAHHRNFTARGEGSLVLHPEVFSSELGDPVINRFGHAATALALELDAKPNALATGRLDAWVSPIRIDKAAASPVEAERLADYFAGYGGEKLRKFSDPHYLREEIEKADRLAAEMAVKAGNAPAHPVRPAESREYFSKIERWNRRLAASLRLDLREALKLPLDRMKLTGVMLAALVRVNSAPLTELTAPLCRLLLSSELRSAPP